MPNQPNPSLVNLNALTFAVRISLSPRQPRAGQKASNRKVRTFHVSVAGSTIGGWSQASADAAIADWQKQARLRIKAGQPVLDLSALIAA